MVHKSGSCTPILCKAISFTTAECVLSLSLRFRVVRLPDFLVAKTFQSLQPRPVEVTQECLSWKKRVRVRAWQHGLFSHGARPREDKVSITVNRAIDWLYQAWGLSVNSACTSDRRKRVMSRYSKRWNRSACCLMMTRSFSGKIV